MYQRARYVRGTNNAAIDTANLQAAIDAVSDTTSDDTNRKQSGVVLLSGIFQINQTITAGNSPVYGGSEVNPPTIIGVGRASLVWAGGVSSSYILRYMNPVWNGSGAQIANVNLFCQEACRGLLLQNVTYTKGIEGMTILQAREIGLDVIDCWSGFIRNCRVNYCDGIALRANQANSVVWENIDLDNGEDTDWPSTTDDTVKNYLGNSVQTADAERACMVIYDGNFSAIRNIGFEQSDYGAYPLVYADHIESVAFERIRLEDAANTNERMIFNDSRRVKIMSVSRAASACSCFARLKGTCDNFVFDEIVCNDDYADAIVILDGGTHAGHMVTRAVDTSGDMVQAKWIVEANTPSLPGAISVDSDRQVSVPWTLAGA